MFKFLLILLIIVAVVAYFAARQGGGRPPRDDRRRRDGPDPILPAGSIGHDTGRKPVNDPAPDNPREPALSDSGSSDAAAVMAEAEAIEVAAQSPAGTQPHNSGNMP